MKGFDLNSYGVQEMSVQEMKKTVAGWKFFGWNYSGGDAGGCYTFNLFWIPIYSTCTWEW